VIDFVKKFEKHEQTLLDFGLTRKERYYSSPCFRDYKRKHDRMRDAINMKSPITQNNTFNSKISFPYVREQFLLRRGVTKKNFRNNPLFTLDPLQQTPMDFAKTTQDLLVANLRQTNFRALAFEKMVDFSSRYGPWVAYSRFHKTTQMGWKTTFTPEALQPYSREYRLLNNHENVRNVAINPMNYFQDPDEIYPEQSTIRGFVDCQTVDVLIADVKANPRNYIKKNIVEVIKRAKDFGINETDKYSEATRKNDFSHVKVDINRIWTTLPIKGNEDDSTTYYMEIVGDKIIRFHENFEDENMVPLTCGTYRQRLDYWWGNTDAEDVQPHENFITLLMQMKADQALRLMDSMVFMPKGYGVDWATLNERHENGGVVFYDDKPNVDMRKMVVPWQPQDNSSSNIDYIMREVKESKNRMSPNPDLASGFNSGGMNNKTATAALMAGEEGDALQSDMLEVFGFGMVELARKNVSMLQQYLGDTFDIRPNPRQLPREAQKYEILGDYDFKIVSSLQKNKIAEFQRLHNLLTGIANFKGTPDQTWQNVQTTPLIRKYLQTADIGDVDKVLTDTPEGQEVPIPGAPGPVQVPGGIPVPEQVPA